MFHQARPGKRKFKLAPPVQRAPKTVPFVGQVVVGDPVSLAPPSPLADKLSRGNMFVAISVEANVKVQGSAVWLDGRFGFKSKVSSDDLEVLNVVEVGWALGDLSQDGPDVKSYIVAKEGKALKEILEELLSDVFAARAAGGRLVAHQIEFDAGIIQHEMRRTGLGHLVDDWAATVKDGVCTMQPETVHWVRQMVGDDDAKDLPYNIPMRLDDLAVGLLPRSKLGKRGGAGENARVRWEICRELCLRARKC